MKKTLFKLIKIVLIVTFLILLIRLIDFESLKDVIVRAQIKYLILAVLFTPGIVFLNSYKWHLLINRLRKISYSESLKSYLAGYAVGVVSPIKGGEFLRAYFIKGKLSHTGFLVLIDKLIDISVICSYALIGLLLFFPKYFYIILIILGVLFFIIYNPAKTLKSALKIVPDVDFLKKVVQKIRTYKPVAIPYKVSTLVLLIAFFSCFIAYLQFYLILLAFDSEVMLKAVFFVIPLGSIAKLIPLKVISSQASIVLIISLFSLYGISKEAALSAIFLQFFFFQGAIAIIGLPIASKKFYNSKGKRKISAF
jgi:uncharacterized protein (TIRG00374 family)